LGTWFKVGENLIKVLGTFGFRLQLEKVAEEVLLGNDWFYKNLIQTPNL
jgi:hypothetical protein